MHAHRIYDPKKPTGTVHIARTPNELAKTVRVIKSAVVMIPANSPDDLRGVPLSVLAAAFRGKLPRGKGKAAEAVFHQITRRPGVTSRLEELALEGSGAQAAVDRVRAEFPNSKASRSDFYIARSNLRKKGLID